MKYTTPQSLLALPATVSSPSAYQILGLPDFEPDRIRIRTAGEMQAAKLGQLQGQADADAWDQANKWLKSATTILSDASKKSAYDRKLLASRPVAAVDPLAGMLPGRPSGAASHAVASSLTGSPVGAAPPTPPTVGGPVGVPVSVPGLPTGPGYPSVGSAPGPGYAGAAWGPNANGVAGTYGTPESGIATDTGTPLVKRRVSTARKKGLPILPVAIMVFCLGCIGGLGYLAYKVANGDQAITLSINRGPVVNVVDPNGDGKAVVVPGAVSDRNRVPYDPVMGGLGNNVMPPGPATEVTDNPGTDATADQAGMENTDAADMTMPATGNGGDMPTTEVDPMAQDMATMPEMTDTNPAGSDPTQPTTETTTPPIPTTPEPTPTPPTPTPPGPTPEEIKAGDVAIATVREAALRYQWDRLKPLAEAAEMAAKTDPQIQLAQGLYQLMDLATYYRDGIFKTMQTLRNGQELDLKEGVKLIIVEITPQQLVIRINGVNKSYPLNALPPPLISRLGEMAMPDDSATSRAAKYAYQVLAESTNGPFRARAVQDLSQIDEEIEGAELEQLLAAIRFLYPQ